MNSIREGKPRVLRPYYAASLALLAALAALAACTGTTPLPETTVSPTSRAAPTEAPTPTMSPASTSRQTRGATVSPTATPVRPPTLAPKSTSLPTSEGEGETPTGVLSPLNLRETEDINSELSGAEVACLMELGPILHLRWEWILPGPGDQEERVEIIGCLEDETVARIFLADIVMGARSLSLESSACVRAAFSEISPRSMLLAKVDGYPEDTLHSATVLYFITMACLSDEEWATADKPLREDSGIREVMRCMMEKVGGPGVMAAAMTNGEEGDQKVLSEAAADCGEKTGPTPGRTDADPPPATTGTPVASTPRP